MTRRQTFRVPINHLRLKPNIPAGMDICVLVGLVPLLRKTTKDPPPVELRRLAADDWLVLDGRHRFLAAVVAGRPDVLAYEEDA